MKRRTLLVSPAWLVAATVSRRARGQATAAPAAGSVAESKSALLASPRGFIDILPGKGLRGWTRLPILPGGKLWSDVEVWKVDAKARLLTCAAHLPESVPDDKPGSHEFFRYDRELGDFTFHVEWRYTDPGRKGWNSGIFARNSADGKIWHQAQIGNQAGGFWFGDSPDDAGNIARQKLVAKENRVKPAGEWNTTELTARGNALLLWMNGATVCEWPDLKVARGYIGLEAERHAIEFKNLKLKIAG